MQCLELPLPCVDDSERLTLSTKYNVLEQLNLKALIKGNYF